MNYRNMIGFCAGAGFTTALFMVAGVEARIAAFLTIITFVVAICLGVSEHFSRIPPQSHRQESK